MTTLDTSKEAVTKAAKTVTDATVSAGTKAKDFSTTTAKTVVDATTSASNKAVDFTATTAKTVVDNPAVAKAKGVTTTTAKSVVDSPVVAKAKDVTATASKTVNDHELVVTVMGFGAAAATATIDTFKVVFDKASSTATMTLEMVSDLPLGGQNVGERVEHTVDTVQDKIDVEQIQDQVAKLRHQIDGVVESWQESFRPTTAQKAKAQVKATAKKAPASTKATAKK
jgi:hypothetical protein